MSSRYLTTNITVSGSASDIRDGTVDEQEVRLGTIGPESSVIEVRPGAGNSKIFIQLPRNVIPRRYRIRPIDESKDELPLTLVDGLWETPPLLTHQEGHYHLELDKASDGEFSPENYPTPYRFTYAGGILHIIDPFGNGTLLTINTGVETAASGFQRTVVPYTRADEQDSVALFTQVNGEETAVGRSGTGLYVEHTTIDAEFLEAIKAGSLVFLTAPGGLTRHKITAAEKITLGGRDWQALTITPAWTRPADGAIVILAFYEIDTNAPARELTEEEVIDLLDESSGANRTKLQNLIRALQSAGGGGTRDIHRHRLEIC